MASTLYGTDTSTAGGTYHPGVLVSEEQAVGEALERRWSCQRGRNLEDPDYGLPLNRFLCSEFTQEGASRIAGDIKNEGEKDDRVQSITATPTIVGTGASLSISIDLLIQLKTGTTFTLTALVSELSVQILGIKEPGT